MGRYVPKSSSHNLSLPRAVKALIFCRSQQLAAVPLPKNHTQSNRMLSSPFALFVSNTPGKRSKGQKVVVLIERLAPYFSDFLRLPFFHTWPLSDHFVRGSRSLDSREAISIKPNVAMSPAAMPPYQVAAGAIWSFSTPPSTGPSP
jgi:hypothetical protein